MARIIKFCFFTFTFSFGQFGQNIVQYEYFDWSYIQSRHFDIYYYANEDGRSHADFVAEEAEKAYDKISRSMDWKLQHRVSIIVYNSHNDFQQTNVIDSYMFEGIGGVTELYKNRIVIPFDGSNLEFRHVIHHELVHAFINDSVYGGSVREMVTSSIKVIIPGWMNEGLAEYLASGWDAKSDMWMRDLAINGDELPDIHRLTGYWAYRGGQSVWKFITQKWGEESIAEILYRIKSTNSVEKGLKRALGVNFKELNKQWHEQIKKDYWPEVTKRDNLLDFARQLTDHEKWKNTYNVAPAIAPDGSRIAILSNKDGPMALYMISAEDGHIIKKIIQGERSAEYEELHILKPGISWSPDSKQLVFAAKSGLSDALFIMDAQSYKTKKYRLGMEGIFRPAWSPTQNQIAFVGNNGRTGDLYLFDLDSEELTNLTQDWYTDDHVTWHPDGESLLFISDRGNNISTGNFEMPHNYDVQQTDIYEYHLIENKITRTSGTPWNETYPTMSDDGKYLAFISDESGISNIMMLEGGDAAKPITNVITGITQLSWNGDDSQLIFTGFHKSGYDIFTLSNPKERIHKGIIIPNMDWVEDDTELSFLRRKETGGRSRYVKDDEYRNYIFSGFDATEMSLDTSQVIELSESTIKDSAGIYKTNIYRTRFTLDNAQVVYALDSQYGSQGMAYFVFSDILGDHRVYLATEMEVSLKNSDYYFIYRYLRNKIDWNFSLYHNAVRYGYQPYINPNVLTSQNYSRYRILGLHISGMRPFSRFSRVEASIDVNYTEDASIEEWIYNNEIHRSESVNSSYMTAIPGFKYVWDNTLWSQMYPISGSRLYLKYRTSPQMHETSLNFHRLTSDIRGYVKIGNGVSVASRFFAGTNWGANSQNFRLGGVPWMFSNDHTRVRINELTAEELYFSEYLMPLRGAMISQRVGAHALLFNFEARLPFLLYYFPTIKYFGQINGVIFLDVGVAWDDDYPEFFDELSWETNSENGWNMSLGFGPRFIFLGMPWQLDYAWEFNPHKGIISDRKWYLTIGLDY